MYWLRFCTRIFKVNRTDKICACYLKQTVIIKSVHAILANSHYTLKKNVAFITLMEISYTTSNKETQEGMTSRI